MKIDTPAAGFYALNGESVLSFPPNQENENICGCFEKVREQNPLAGILLVLDNFSSHVCKYTRNVESPDLNPIEPVWKSLKWESSSLIVDGEDEYRSLLDKPTKELSFAALWIDNPLRGFLNRIC